MKGQRAAAGTPEVSLEANPHTNPNAFITWPGHHAPVQALVLCSAKRTEDSSREANSRAADNKRWGYKPNLLAHHKESYIHEQKEDKKEEAEGR
eukprot:CAMPEP_0179479226 /NCGR_PEP_ID=MMETSP0799-20121207/57513_1 /TAXON_ID=46947 /ORGANISM="Geminigera cryophila, Strain CCMP2564" /LENGTH=93 /DNA_ID=CAMNT_0021290739 /DNA_START=18 /DNA_END=296 /DNA_ORIENTATION=+